uniref:NADH-ubiquinone oxidoreductase chain 4L n=1 Tax=Bannacoris arboreus TaxID=1837149 RepID=A0A2P1CMG4_9HEMI|nr:NADH dehydrogenase subunit 4L [Bannacoris arboreus]AVJ52520.1 NADH dehydrogenase subunit 4L [Bannacoris arboreus]WEM32394.1 NADH dehydrogenase subunit 4L [Bannacoris arboreus]
MMMWISLSGMIGLIVFCSLRKHILLALLALEFIVLLVYLMVFLTMFNMGYELYFSLIFLIFSVCESALGLSILVNMVRVQGNDNLYSMSILTW